MFANMIVVISLCLDFIWIHNIMKKTEQAEPISSYKFYQSTLLRKMEGWNCIAAKL